MKLIVGLGNPGTEYTHTRHNIGFLCVDELARKLDLTWSTDTKKKTDVAKGVLGDTTFLLIKPQTFMNLSGEAVQAITAYYKVALSDILIVHDEMDFKPGDMRFSKTNSPGGHNGIASIFEHLDGPAILRLRLGIDRPPPPQPAEKWVLGPLAKETTELIPKAAQAIQDWLTEGPERAMNKWNKKEG
jgi:peptidyl-tRNA hydrolase, PTH1 family